jgi:hypothetical protein
MHRKNGDCRDNLECWNPKSMNFDRIVEQFTSRTACLNGHSAIRRIARCGLIDSRDYPDLTGSIHNFECGGCFQPFANCDTAHFPSKSSSDSSAPCFGVNAEWTHPRMQMVTRMQNDIKVHSLKRCAVRQPPQQRQSSKRYSSGTTENDRQATDAKKEFQGQKNHLRGILKRPNQSTIRPLQCLGAFTCCETTTEETRDHTESTARQTQRRVSICESRIIGLRQPRLRSAIGHFSVSVIS